MIRNAIIKISVIVPVYKAEKTICRCVDSLLAQDLDGVEVILVDDESPDSCPVICDNYELKDSRIRVVHQKNGGVAVARQVGVDAAQGEYTIQADPDDWVDPGMLSALYTKAKENDADIVICDYWENTYLGQKRIVQKPSALNHETVLREIFTCLHGSTCNKLIRKACYEKYAVNFPEGISFCEDLFVCASLLKHNIRISYLDEAYYHYERLLNTKSLSKGYSYKSYEQDRELESMFRDLLKDTQVGTVASENRRYSTMARAFYFGRDVFTSRSFRSCFQKDLPLVWHQQNTLFERFALTISCLGGYQFVRKVLSVLMAIKHKLKQ